jgi:hypothetical protein
MTDLGGKKWEYEAVIASGAALSGWVRLNSGNLVGLIIPSTWTTANITVQVSRDGGVTPHNLRDADGNEVTFIVTAGTWIALPAGAFNGIEEIRFRSGTAASPVNQGGDRTLVAVLRAFG